MIVKKRMKTLGYEIRDLSDKKQKVEKSTNPIRKHKQSEIHIKSVSKDITPKKHSITGQKSKCKQIGGISNVKMVKSKQLTSVCSYSAIDKESIQATKRKGSNTISVKKKRSKNNHQIQQSLKSTVTNFSVLTKCLTEYIKQEKKKGNDPSTQILQLIKAFNRSEVAPLSKQLQVLINNMLDYIEDTVTINNKQEEQDVQNDDIIRIKSRSSFSSASEREIAYSQILQNSFVPSTIKKPQQKNERQNQSSFDSKNLRSKQHHNISDMSKKQFNQQNNDQIKKKFVKSKDEKIQNRQLQKQLKQDLKNMQDQLYSLKSAGQKLKYKVDNKWQDRIKLQQIYSKNKKVLQTLSVNNTQSLKKKNNKQRIQQNQQSVEQGEDN